LRFTFAARFQHVDDISWIAAIILLCSPSSTWPEISGHLAVFRRDPTGSAGLGPVAAGRELSATAMLVLDLGL
jgi:hypothetical protein